jgi:hypothetical protein
MNRFSMIAAAALLLSGPAFAAESKTYEVSITNITPGQAFTPVLAATHSPDIRLFRLGEAAIEELELLAENGMTAPLEDLLLASGKAQDTSGTGGLLLPGETMSFEIQGSRRYGHLSLAAMLLPTHDNFVALDAIPLPKQAVTVYAKGYDAGTEANVELCDHIPGPPCFGTNEPDDSGEGFVHIGSGIHGVGELDPAVHDWNNPVARITVRRVR